MKNLDAGLEYVKHEIEGAHMTVANGGFVGFKPPPPLALMGLIFSCVGSINSNESCPERLIFQLMEDTSMKRKNKKPKSQKLKNTTEH